MKITKTVLVRLSTITSGLPKNNLQFNDQDVKIFQLRCISRKTENNCLPKLANGLKGKSTIAAEKATAKQQIGVDLWLSLYRRTVTVCNTSHSQRWETHVTHY